MKINNGNIRAIYATNYINKDSNKIGNGVNKIGRVNKMDTCELSSVGKQLNKFAIEDEAFEVDEKKVNEVRNKVQNGTYTVDSKVLAKAMMKHMKGGQE